MLFQGLKEGAQTVSRDNSYFIMVELLFHDMRLLLRCKLVVPHYSHLSTHRLYQLVVKYFFNSL